MSEYRQPPKLPLRILRWFCSEQRLEELEGDLCEVYNEHIINKGSRFANTLYWWLVFRSFRSFALKRTKMKNSSFIGSLLMFMKHNLIVSWRNMLKNKTVTSINVLGLAIGISTFIAIYRIVHFELSFNKEIPDNDRIYRIYSTYSGVFEGTNRGVSTAVPNYIRENLTGIDHVVHFQNFAAQVQVGDENKEMAHQEKILLTDSNYFNVIDQYVWIVGSKESSLSEPFQLVLTTSQAELYFGSPDYHNHIGKKVTYEDSLIVHVAGIVQPAKTITDFDFTDFISYNTIKSSWLEDNYSPDDWSNTNSSSQVFVKTTKGTDFQKLTTQLVFLNEYAQSQEDEDSDWFKDYKAQPLSDLHYNPDLGIFDTSGGASHLPTLTVMSLVAIFLLLIAVFNFINLETAQATNKSKEVGVRKVMGSNRNNLIGRFLTESFAITFLAIVISIPISYYGLGWFEEFVPEGVTLGFDDPTFWLFLVILNVVVGALAGLYPSFVVSSFKPISSLRAGAKFTSSSAGGAYLRKFLITFQFLFSQLLIVGTLVVIVQISFMLDKDLGFEGDGVIYTYAPYYESDETNQVFLNKVRQIPELSEISVHNSPPARPGYSTSAMTFQSDTGEIKTSVHRRGGDENYLEFYDIELIAGRNVRADEDGLEILINETYVKRLGISQPEDALDLQIEMNDKKLTVVGVMQDFHFRSLHSPIDPLMYRYEEDIYCIGMKLKLDETLEQTIDKLEAHWSEVYPEETFKMRFMDETIEEFYNTERRTSKLASTATGIAIFISCLGLFGLISFTIAQRSKEMGIRKVLGATMVQIGSIISKEFVILVGIAFIISTPISHLFLQKWMEDFAYQTDISYWVYLAGGMVSLLIALASISFKIWKASTANPVDSLRYE